MSFPFICILHLQSLVLNLSVSPIRKGLVPWVAEVLTLSSSTVCAKGQLTPSQQPPGSASSNLNIFSVYNTCSPRVYLLAHGYFVRSLARVAPRALELIPRGGGVHPVGTDQLRVY